MPKILPDGEPYAGRRNDCAVLNVTVDREVKELAQQWAPGKRMGELIGRLIYQERSRREERARLARLVLDGDGGQQS